MLEHAFSGQVYILLLFGILVEEDAAIIPAAFLVHEGRLRFAYVLLVSVVGSMLLHLVIYLLTMHWWRDSVARKAASDPRWARVQTAFRQNHQTWLLLSRFLWGLRYPIVSVAALANVGFWEFLILDGVGCVLWAITALLLGYYCGDTLQAFSRHLRSHDREIALVLCIVVLVGVLVVKRRRRSRPLARGELLVGQTAPTEQ